jgi:hypothetical protein
VDVPRSPYYPLTIVAGSNGNEIVYRNVTSNTDVIYHSIAFWDQAMFSKADDYPVWGTPYYAMKNVSIRKTLPC